MITESPELIALRQKLLLIEYDLEENRKRLDTITSKQSWLAEQRSECLKIIARLTVAKTQE